MVRRRRPRMRTILALMLAAFLLVPMTAQAQDAGATLDAVAKALGAGSVTTIQYEGAGVVFAAGQSMTPGTSWPRFNLKSYARTVNYASASAREDQVRTQAENPPRAGGLQPIRGEQKLVFFVSGDQAWNVTGETAVATPVALAERQFQLWATPHGFIKAAMANNA